LQSLEIKGENCRIESISWEGDGKPTTIPEGEYAGEPEMRSAGIEGPKAVGFIIVLRKDLFDN